MIEVQNNQIETIESGKPKPKVENYKSDAHSPRGIVLGLLQKFRNDSKKGKTYTPKELEFVFSESLRRLNLVEPLTKSTINLPGWKGKDDIQFIEKPDSFDIITHQKQDQDSEPKESKRNIHKNQVNNVINALYSSKKVKDRHYIETKEIARNYCLIADLRHNKKGNELFPNGLFEWDNFFGDRRLHTELNLILRLLDKSLVIHYRAGRTQILKNNFEFQIELP